MGPGFAVKPPGPRSVVKPPGPRSVEEIMSPGVAVEADVEGIVDPEVEPQRPVWWPCWAVDAPSASAARALEDIVEAEVEEIGPGVVVGAEVEEIVDPEVEPQRPAWWPCGAADASSASSRRRILKEFLVMKFPKTG